MDEHELPARLRGLTLAAPYNDKAATWLADRYVAIEGPPNRTYRITVDRVDPEVGDDGSGRIRVLDYGDLVRGLPLHPEAKSLGPDGALCGPQTRGLLSRRTIEISTAVHVGKRASLEVSSSPSTRRRKTDRHQATDRPLGRGAFRSALYRNPSTSFNEPRG